MRQRDSKEKKWNEMRFSVTHSRVNCQVVLPNKESGDSRKYMPQTVPKNIRITEFPHPGGRQRSQE